MKTAFLALVFLAELAAWTAIGIAAFRLTGGGWLGGIAAAAAVGAALVAWGRWASPKASAPPRIAWTVKGIVFGLAVVGLALVSQPWWAAALAVVIVVAQLGVWATGRGDATPDA